MSHSYYIFLFLIVFLFVVNCYCVLFVFTFIFISRNYFFFPKMFHFYLVSFLGGNFVPNVMLSFVICFAFLIIVVIFNMSLSQVICLWDLHHVEELLDPANLLAKAAVSSLYRVCSCLI